MEISSWALLVCGVIWSWLNPKEFKSFFRHPMVVATLTFCLWALVGLLVMQSQVANFWIQVAELRWIFSFGGLLTALFCFVSQRSYEKVLNRWCLIFAFILLLIGAYGCFQYFYGQDLLRGSRHVVPLAVDLPDFKRFRPIGFFRDTLTFAASIGMASAFLFAGGLRALRRKEMGWFILFAIACFFTVASSYLTLSRGLWIAVVPALFVMAFIAHRKIFGVLMLLVALAFGSWYFVSPTMQSRVAQMNPSANDQSINHRYMLWQSNFEMFKDHRFWGVGYENTVARVAEYHERLGFEGAIISHAHNNYLNVLASNGAIGLGLYLVFILAGLWYSFKNWRHWHYNSESWLGDLSLASLGAQIVPIIGGLTEYNFGDAEVQYQLLFWMALTVAISAKTRDDLKQ